VLGEVSQNILRNQIDLSRMTVNDGDVAQSEANIFIPYQMFSLKEQTAQCCSIQLVMPISPLAMSTID
jgi:hypothetical protein